MLSLRIGLARCLAIALLAAFVFPVKPARAQVQTNTTASNLPATRLKVTSNLVVVRVVVRDAQGKPVKGLRKEDFKLFDSGKEQPIVQFEAESGAEPPSPPVASRKPQQAVAALSSALPGRFLALYFDDQYTSDSDMAQVRQAADDYLAAHLQPTDRVAIFTSAKMLSDFTSDSKQIHEALSRLRASGRAPAPGHDCPDLSDYQALEMTKTAGKVDLNNPWNTGDAWGLAFEEAGARDCLPSLNKLANKNFLLDKASTVAGQAEILTRSNLRELEEVVKYTAQMPVSESSFWVPPASCCRTTTSFNWSGSSTMRCVYRWSSVRSTHEGCRSSRARWTHPGHTCRGRWERPVELCIVWTKTGKCSQGMFWHRLRKARAANTFTTTTI
jgi:VWFA-related protein